MSLRAFRVGVVGARRVRDGTGPFLARFFQAAGCHVVGVAGSSLASAALAARELAPFGIAATPHPSAVALVERERLDALVIASPDATHAALLDLALDAGLHALCEKPLVHGVEGAVARGTALVDAFARRGLHLAVNAQWRHALPAYLRLFPDVTPRSATRFAMHLTPGVRGVAMVANSLPHPLAILEHLYPGERHGLSEVAVSVRVAETVVVRFRHPGRGVACEVVLSPSEARPRALAFGFDGAMAHRVVREPGHRTSLATADGTREVPLPDPVEAVVKGFVALVRKGPPFPADRTTVPGLVHLDELERAVGAALATRR